MNPHANQPTSLGALVRSLWRHRQLIVEMTKREIIGRYKGSVMGLVWSFLNPVLMLAVYTFFFSVVFKARWQTGTAEPESRGMFAILLFAGLIVHGLFAEVLNKSPQLMLANVNYVKKVVFPLEILPFVALGAAVFHAMVSILVLLLAFVAVNGHLQWTAVFLPLVFFPLLPFTLGIAMVLASLGVYLRDVGQTVGIFTTVMLFLSPVFFPVDALPESLRPWMMANPLTFIIEQSRSVVIWGRLPDWLGLAQYTAAASLVAWIGHAWFQKTRKGFADVL